MHPDLADLLLRAWLWLVILLGCLGAPAGAAVMLWRLRRRIGRAGLPQLSVLLLAGPVVLIAAAYVLIRIGLPGVQPDIDDCNATPLTYDCEDGALVLLYAAVPPALAAPVWPAAVLAVKAGALLRTWLRSRRSPA